MHKNYYSYIIGKEGNEKILSTWLLGPKACLGNGKYAWIVLKGAPMEIKFCLSLAKYMGKYVTGLEYNQVNTFGICMERMARRKRWEISTNNNHKVLLYLTCHRIIMII